ncbi:MAG TPA: hypothetical protein VLC09_12450 [Polyangiaceae bacterium]|nr:hypothetical protein [Polyangiaceae bacterium]
MEAHVTETTKDLLERALDLMMHTNPERALEPVLDRALGLLVAKLETEKRATAERPRPATTPPAPARPCLSSTQARWLGPQKRARPAIPRATVRFTRPLHETGRPFRDALKSGVPRGPTHPSQPGKLSAPGWP